MWSARMEIGAMAEAYPLVADAKQAFEDVAGLSW